MEMLLCVASSRQSGSQTIGADIVKSTGSGAKSTFDLEDQLVMETKLKIIEILQVVLSLF